MSDQFLGEIRAFGCNYPPYGWAFCNGQLLGISQNSALFSLIGTYYGGDGTTTFALPNLQVCVPIGQGTGPGLTPRVVGETSGVPSVTLLQSTMPGHTHQLQAHTGRLGTAHAVPVAGDALITSANGSAYSATAQITTMGPQSLGVYGGSQPHNNLMQYQALNYCIALQGVFPQRN